MTTPRFNMTRTFLIILVFLGVPALLVGDVVNLKEWTWWHVAGFILLPILTLALLDDAEGIQNWIARHFPRSTVVRFERVTAADIQDAARAARVRLVGLRKEGRGFRATLALDPDTVQADGFARWQRVQAKWNNPRRVNAVCWHGHLYFFACLFLAHPDAKVSGGRETGFVYDGARGFLDNYEDTGDNNIGSQAEPIAARDACLCSVRSGNWIENAEAKAQGVRDNLNPAT